MAEKKTSHPYIILGLFDNERDADAALSTLATSGLSQDAIKVIDKPSVEETEPDIPYPAYKAGASLGPMRPEPEATPAPDVTEGAAPDPRSELQQLLQGLNLDPDEAHYFSDGVYEGGTLVLVQVRDEETQRQVRRVLTEAGAANLNH